MSADSDISRLRTMFTTVSRRCWSSTSGGSNRFGYPNQIPGIYNDVAGTLNSTRDSRLTSDTTQHQAPIEQTHTTITMALSMKASAAFGSKVGAPQRINMRARVSPVVSATLREDVAR